MHNKLLLSLPLVILLTAASALAAKETVQMPMQDGTLLTADVHTPEGEGPWPVILMRSTYGRGQDPKDFLEQGYAMVIQDTRGRGDSAGEKHVFYTDGWREGLRDGADTVAWIAEQPWCNGKIGTMGGSALGITQMLLAPTTDQVQAQFIVVGPANFYPEFIYPGGVWSKNLLEGWLTMIQEPHVIDLWKAHPYYDDFWQYYNTTAQAPRISAPALFVGAWQDIFAQGTLDAFTERETHGAPGARGNNLLIMKWGVHGPDTSPYYTFQEDRFALKEHQIRNAFFRRWLQGDETALDGVAKIHYYVLGADTPDAPGNEWRTADHWPPYATEDTRFYLTQDGGLSASAPGDTDAFREYTFDPARPAGTYGGANLLIPSGPYDQRKVSDRPDVLKFVSAPLEAPLEITGRVRVRLQVSSDAPDTDFTAKLIDQYPDGDDREILMLDSIRRVKMRGGFDAPQPLLEGPDQVVELEIDLHSVAWIFNQGHRIALHISSSNHPRFEVNPNTGEDFPGEELRPANNRVHLSADHASYLELPVRP